MIIGKAVSKFATLLPPGENNQDLINSGLEFVQPFFDSLFPSRALIHVSSPLLAETIPSDKPTIQQSNSSEDYRKVSQAKANNLLCRCGLRSHQSPHVRVTAAGAGVITAEARNCCFPASTTRFPLLSIVSSPVMTVPQTLFESVTCLDPAGTTGNTTRATKVASGSPGSRKTSGALHWWKDPEGFIQ